MRFPIKTVQNTAVSKFNVLVYFATLENARISTNFYKSQQHGTGELSGQIFKYCCSSIENKY